MNKTLLWLLITLFGAAGGYLPYLIGANSLSIWSIVGSTVGGIFGIFAAYKINS